MPIVRRKPSLIFAACLILTGSAAINTATAQTKPTPSQPETTQANTDNQNTPGTATTDGQLAIVELGTTKPNILNPPTPALQTRPAEGNR